MEENGKPRWRLRLVELAVVLGVLGLLAALTVYGIRQGREAGRRSQCSNNLKQICLALLNYEHVNRSFPPGMLCDKGEDPALTTVFRPNWVIFLLPYTELAPLQRSFDMTASISAERNRAARGTPFPVLLCPTDGVNNGTPFAGASEAEGDNWARGNYAVNAGNSFITKDGGVVDANSPQWRDPHRRGVMAVNDATMDLADITDGTSMTILVGEVRAGASDKDRRGVWAMGGAGSSIACAHGSWGDDNGPNACFPWGDDIKGADQIEIGPASEDQCMSAWGKSGSRQATFRSLHPGGCNIAFADCSVHFIENEIETSGPWGDPNPDFWPIWDRLICSSDANNLIYVAHIDGVAHGGFRPPPHRPPSLANVDTLVKVRGHVRSTDGTLPSGEYRFVTFNPEITTTGNDAPAKGAGGAIKPDGRFEMTTIKPGDGVLPGHYKVTIRCLKNYADPGSLTIPKKYADVATTPLEVTIDAARSDLVFELEK